jgi:glycerate kinase
VFQRRRTFLATLGLLAALGCGDRHQRGRGLTIEEVPDVVLKAAKKRLPDVDFDSAWVEKEGNEETYEVMGHTREGKQRDVKVSASGEILEVD